MPEHARKAIQNIRMQPFSTTIREGIIVALSFSIGNPMFDLMYHELKTVLKTYTEICNYFCIYLLSGKVNSIVPVEKHCTDACSLRGS